MVPQVKWLNALTGGTWRGEGGDTPGNPRGGEEARNTDLRARLGTVYHLEDQSLRCEKSCSVHAVRRIRAWTAGKRDAGDAAEQSDEWCCRSVWLGDVACVVASLRSTRFIRLNIDGLYYSYTAEKPKWPRIHFGDQV